jgi:hypothetical protein
LISQAGGQDGVNEVERGVGGGDPAAKHQCVVDPEVIRCTPAGEVAAVQALVGAADVGGAKPPW